MIRNLSMLFKKEKDIENGTEENAEKEPLTKSITKNLPKIKIPLSPSTGSLTALTEMFMKSERSSFKARPNLSMLNITAATQPHDLSPSSRATSSLRPSDSSPSTRSPSPSPHINAVGPNVKWRRSDRRLRRLNTELLESAEIGNLKIAKKCLDDGARPNATCRKECITACHIAAHMGHSSILLELLHRGADPYKADASGRTPLHLAAWAGHVECLAILLDVPEDIFLGSTENCNEENVTEDIVEYFKRSEELRNSSNQNIDVKCIANELKPMVPKNCRDSFEHECMGLKDLMPTIPGGFTALHAACAMAQYDCLQILMAAGAKLDTTDDRGRMPLDAVGDALIIEETEDDKANDHADNFLSVVKTLLEIRAPNTKMTFTKQNENEKQSVIKCNTPLHVAVELESMPALLQLLEAGAYPGCLNDAGETPIHVSVLKKLTEPLKCLSNMWLDEDIQLTPYIDLKDSSGFTPLQVAVKERWVPGVCILLEAGANVDVVSDNGDTALHFAAESGSLELLDEILSVVKKGEMIDSANKAGESALFKAVITNHLDCVRSLILEGASIYVKLPDDVSMIHKAAEYGFVDVLNELLKIDSESNKPTINDIDKRDAFGMNALHFATFNNHADCVEVILKHGADIRARTSSLPHYQSTALHIAVTEGHSKPVDVILNQDRLTTEEVDLHGWLPIHSACHHGRRDCILSLVNAGADLSVATYDPKRIKRSAIDMLIHNVSNPKDFLEEVFDSFITLKGGSFSDSSCEVKVDYSVLMPNKDCVEQMRVIVCLLDTGNRFEQKKLLLHPLIESFLYLKWRALSPFFYGILVFYGLFVIALTTLVFSSYYSNDTKLTPPGNGFIITWKYILFVSISCILIQEIFYMKKNIIQYFATLETWVKLGSFMTSIAFAVIQHDVDNEWPRHITTIAILLAWTEMMFLLSRFPNWGYYVLMFSKVALNVMKVLLTFAFLLIGFSIAFMLQFHSHPPFDTPWAALIKTLVMMTSEFDYMSLFEDTTEADSMLVGRIMFVVFLVLASIVLMNLLVGLAVSDINDLEIQGKIQRLAKQVDFLGTLDSFVYNEPVIRWMPKKFVNRIRAGRNVDSYFMIYPGRPRWRTHKLLPTILKNAILAKASHQKQKADETEALKTLASQVSDIHSHIASKRKKSVNEDKSKSKIPKIEAGDEDEDRPRKKQLRHQEIVEMISDVREEVIEVKETLNKNITEEIEKRLDRMYTEIDYLARMMKVMMERMEVTIPVDTT